MGHARPLPDQIDMLDLDSIGAGDPILRLALPKPGLDLSHLLIRRHARPERAARDETDQKICQAGEYAIVRFFGGVGAGCEGIREKFGLIRRPAIYQSYARDPARWSCGPALAARCTGF